MPTKIADAWRGWYHVNGNTYGTWIRGDLRGWRARHHREHVEGDYKNPPPPARDREQRDLSVRLMDEPIFLSPASRQTACDALFDSMIHQSTETIACCVCAKHFHLLARFELPNIPAPMPPTRHQPIYAHIRRIIGQAKSHATHELARAKLVEPGGVWATRCKITAIADREHQLAVFRYIQNHARQGASVRTFRDQPGSQPVVQSVNLQ